MKSCLRFPALKLISSILLCSAASVFAFDGMVEMTMTSAAHPDGGMAMTYYMKGAKTRVEMALPAEKAEKTEKTEKADKPDKTQKPEKKRKGRGDTGPMVMISNTETKEMTMLMPQQNMYMVHSMTDPVADSAGSKPAIEFKPSGRKEKIAGVDAEEYVGISEGKQTEVWLAKGMGRFMMATSGQGGGPFGGGRGGPAKSNGWEKFAQQGDLFPLRVIQREKDGAPETFRMEATKIDRTPPSDELFAPPAGAQKLEIPNMGDAMRGMIPGGAH